MAVLKCKMCGGTLDVTEGMTVCECEYCGTMQTIPSVDDEKKITLFIYKSRILIYAHLSTTKRAYTMP